MRHTTVFLFFVLGHVCQPCLFLVIGSARTASHENSTLAYQSLGGLTDIVHHKDWQINALNLLHLNLEQKLLGHACALGDCKWLVWQIGHGNYTNVDRLVRVALSRGRGIRGILEMYEAATKGVYHPKSFTEEEEMLAVLFWRLGGIRLAEIAHCALYLPGMTSICGLSTVPPIQPSFGLPTVNEIELNIVSCFESIRPILESLHTLQAQNQVIHMVLMFDEIAVEKRLWWDHKTNLFLGVCREHAHHTSLEFCSSEDMDALLKRIDEGEVHFASEATVGALCLLSDDKCLNSAHPIIVSGTCKRENGQEHAYIIQTVIDALNKQKDTMTLQTISIASDGEMKRGSALVNLTFQDELSAQSRLYSYLSPSKLPLMNFLLGDNDVTANKDYRHVFKRIRNLLLCERGISVLGVHIMPSILKAHLRMEEDKQDVKLAYNLLKDTWSLPELQHLSTAAHMTLVLFHVARKEFFPTLLFADIMIMIKNVFFCVAAGKINNPNGNFHLILLGTDGLEKLFGILRTMVGNDANVDMLQLANRLTGTTEVANILARYPKWD
ncbi:hypothetical protein EDD18DRAFT_1310464 [Armillaria luteobubalina]|uniref:Uncharacterized protein n=1 Tax=Armillaria luteobubalina TaxID=153913 RepID=A0AA39Q0G0_9AGAR|nr:hypothetical protein EDD18DRAFT_1310464 [Armillaria luteobubalina]